MNTTLVTRYIDLTCCNVNGCLASIGKRGRKQYRVSGIMDLRAETDEINYVIQLDPLKKTSSRKALLITCSEEEIHYLALDNADRVQLNVDDKMIFIELLFPPNAHISFAE